jgi:chitinase
VLPETPKKDKLTPIISQDLVSIEPSVDWFNYMAYDLHGTWDIGNEWTGAILDAHTNLTEIESSMNLLWWNNIAPSKVNLGLAFYGRSFTIASSDYDTPGCAYLSARDEGVYSASASILLSSEIEQIIRDNDLTPVLYKDAAVKAITVGTNFIL